MNAAPAYVIVAVFSLFPGGHQQAASGDSDLLATNRRVILQADLDLNITQLRAFSLFVRNINPVRVQLWRRNNVTNFTLEWQQRLAALPVFGRNIINLDESDWLDVQPEHRLGIFNERDPGPILYTVTSSGTSVFSETAFPDRPPEVDISYQFTALQFPFSFAIILCNFTDCMTPAPTDAPTSTSTRSTQVVPTLKIKPAATAITEEHPLMNGTFLVVLLVWLIVVSFIIITMIIVITYLNVRNKNAIVKAEDKASNGDPEGDWYIVVQDTVQAQRVLSS